MSTNKVLIIISLLAVGIALVYFFAIRQDASQQVFSKHFDKYPNMISPEDREGGGKGAKFDTLMAPYEQGKYGDALNTFNQFLKQNPDNQTITFYRGIAYLQENQLQRAQDDFKEVIVNRDKLIVQSTWYLALTHLKMGNKNDATFYLTQLIDDKTNYANNADEILQSLSSRLKKDQQRVYRIDENGKYGFTYQNGDDATLQPLSAKEFYVQIRFENIIPESVNYESFNKLTPSEQRLLTIRGQQKVLSTMKDGMSGKELSKTLKRADSLLATLGSKNENKTWLEIESEQEVAPRTMRNQPKNVVQLTQKLQRTSQKIDSKKESLKNIEKRYKKTAKQYQDKLLKVATALKEEGKKQQAEAIINHASNFKDYVETYFLKTKKAHIGDSKIPEWFVKEVKQDLSTLDKNKQPPNMPDDVFKARKRIQEVLASALEASQGRMMPDKGIRDEDADMHAKVTKYEVLIEQLATLENKQYEIQELRNNKLQLVAGIVGSDNVAQSQASKENL